MCFISQFYFIINAPRVRDKRNFGSSIFVYVVVPDNKAEFDFHFDFGEDSLNYMM